MASIVPQRELRLHLASPRLVRPTVPTQTVVEQGYARFIVKTPGARITARLRDVPGEAERAIESDSIRLPVGRWIVRATAPGYQTCVWYVQVKPSHSTVVIVSLRPIGAALDSNPPQDS